MVQIIFPTFSAQFKLKFVYSEAINVPNITRCEFSCRCNDVF